MYRFFPLSLMVLLLSCESAVSQKPLPETVPTETTLIHPEGNTIGSRFDAPEGYKIIDEGLGSMSYYLKELPLLPHGSPVMLYNGQQKYNQNAHLAVVDLAIGHRDLHQCADAVMRLHADFHRKNKQYDQIHFNFTNGFRADYSKWVKGQRIKIKGNKTYWVDGGSASDSDPSYWKYLETVWSYAGTLSLSRELKPRNMEDMQIGDVLIQGGSPGHAVMVVSMCQNEAGQKLYMLAQSYMPAQQIQILRNPEDESLSPWYILDDRPEIRTPEWTFGREDLMSF